MESALAYTLRFLVQAYVKQEDTATATGTFGTIRNLATSLSIVVGGVVFQNSMESRAPLLRASGLNSNTTLALSRSSAANVMLISTIQDPRQILAAKEAFAWSLRNVWILSCCLSAAGLVASVFLVKQVLSREHTETKTGLKEPLQTGPLPEPI